MKESCCLSLPSPGGPRAQPRTNNELRATTRFFSPPNDCRNKASGAVGAKKGKIEEIQAARCFPVYPLMYLTFRARFHWGRFHLWWIEMMLKFVVFQFVVAQFGRCSSTQVSNWNTQSGQNAKLGQSSFSVMIIIAKSLPTDKTFLY